MGKINFTITLKSDGEPASGFGTELIDSILPRNSDGHIIIPSPHIKGIIRENLENIPNKLIAPNVIANLFGKENGSSSLFHIDNAVAPKDAKVIDVTRTKLNEFGVADAGSLRTSEAVASGSIFSGTITTYCNLSRDYENLIKLGLLSLFAIGGGRNRGAGACIVTIDNEGRTPGELLRLLATVDFGETPPKDIKENDFVIADDQVTMKLIFKAKNPVCVPEVPITKNNMIRSGFSIPASAVQGAILHRINDISKKTATACYESGNFRAWPLNPSDNTESTSLRVSFTHKISKLKIKNTDNYLFQDETVKPYDWDKISSKSPLTGTDGVLLADGVSVKLWKSSGMARIVSAHGVHNGDRYDKRNSQKRNFFIVESLAPTLFTGIVSMPKSASDLLLKSLKNDSFVQFGKSRSVRGGGDLSAEIVHFATLPIMKKYEKTIFIIQSPVLIPENLVEKSVEEIISAIVKDSGFGEVEKSSGSVTTQFGWNRTFNDKFISAKSVISPGAVFKLKSPIENIEEKLLKGIGGGRKYGFGAVLPHPGVAEQLFHDEAKPSVLAKTDKNFGTEGFELWEKAKESHLSASQISRVRELTGIDADKAIEYLHRQSDDRPIEIWKRWKELINQIEDGIQKDAMHMEKALKVCQDLLVADKGDN